MCKITIRTLSLGACILMAATLCYGEQKDAIQNEAPLTVQEMEYLKDTISTVKKISAKFENTPEDLLIRDKGLISSERRGNSTTIVIFDKQTKEEKKLIYTNSLLKNVRVRDTQGNGYDIFYYENKQVGRFVEYKNYKIDGIFVKFYKNGNLQHLANAHDGGFIGSSKMWDEKGRLTESAEFKEKKEFKFEHKAPK